MAGYFLGLNRSDLLGMVNPAALQGNLVQPNNKIILSSFSGDTTKTADLLGGTAGYVITGTTTAVSGSNTVTKKFVSSNPNIATVTDAGIVTAVAGAKGKTVITFVETNVVASPASTTVSVIRVPVYVHNLATIFNITGNSTTVYIDSEAIAAADGVNLADIFVSASSGTITYTATGVTMTGSVVYASSTTPVNGTVKISQVAVNGAFAARADLTVNIKVVKRIDSLTTNVSNVKLSASNKKLKTKKVVASILPATATVKTLAWSSSAPRIASVNSSGVITAKKPGKAIIKASSTDSSDAIAEVNVVVGK